MDKEEIYPKDFQKFLKQFSDEVSCCQYLIQIRWKEGYVCPNCQSKKYRLTSKHKIHCMLLNRGKISAKHLEYWMSLPFDSKKYQLIEESYFSG
jgi:hypothetical protein